MPSIQPGMLVEPACPALIHHIRPAAHANTGMHAGLDRTPEQTQLCFECVSKICRDLCRQLSADLPATLKATAGLRYSHASYVRGLAAQAVGLLFRHAGNTAHKRGLMALYAGGHGPPWCPRCNNTILNTGHHKLVCVCPKCL